MKNARRTLSVTAIGGAAIWRGMCERGFFPACLLALALIAASLTRNALAEPAVPQPLPITSLMSLITRPEKYDGRRVVVRGYAAFGFEHSYLYLSPYDAQYRINENAIWLMFDGNRFKNWHSLDHETIEVEGTFRLPKGAGYWTNYPNGYLTDITRLELRPRRAFRDFDPTPSSPSSESMGANE